MSLSGRSLAQLLVVLLGVSGCASSESVGKAAGSTATTRAQSALATSSTTTSAPATTSTSSLSSATQANTATTTEAPQPPVCAELLDGAEQVHPSELNTMVADFDGDGINDEIWATASDVAWESSVQVVRSSDGAVSEPLERDSWVGLEHVLAASDIDADGLDEVFYSEGGNTAFTGVVLELNSCELRFVSAGDEEIDLAGDGVFRYTYWAIGNGCAPTGCYFSVTCDAGPDGSTDIVLTSIYPTMSVLDQDFDEADLGVPIEELEVMFGQVTLNVVDGLAMTVNRNEERSVLLGELGDWTSRPEVGCA
jgi:hypothetical protein